MTPYHSGIAFEPRPLVAQEADNACRKLTPEQTIQKKLNHEIHPFNCDDACEEIIDASTGRRLLLPKSIVARCTVASQDPLPPHQEFAPEQEQPRYQDPARDTARNSLYEEKFIDASPPLSAPATVRAIQLSQGMLVVRPFGLSIGVPNTV